MKQIVEHLKKNHTKSFTLMMYDLHVTHIAKNRVLRTKNVDDLVVIVTDTGRTYAIEGSRFSCYVQDGKYISHAQHFIEWGNKLEKSEISNL